MLIRPKALERYRQDLLSLSNSLRLGARHLERALAATKLNDRDPTLAPANLPSRSTLAVGALRRCAVGCDQDTDLLAATIGQAINADRSWPAWLLRPAHPAASCGGALAGWLTLAVDRAVVVADQWSPEPNPQHGDPAGTYRVRPVAMPGSAPRWWWPGEGAAWAGSTTPAARLVADALAATDNVNLLRHDEFGLMNNGDNRYTIVLPGVSDLSRPDHGWNGHHRSVRDLDMAAVVSAQSSDVADNRYARMVSQALLAAQVPEGAELLIVGHSFGADTALDLAADDAFTQRYTLAAVVATGYHSQPQLPAVGGSIPVLVVQNNNDLIVRAERLMPTKSSNSDDCNQPTAVNGNVNGNGNAVVVGFEGPTNLLGHSVDGYRMTFTGDNLLPGDDQAALDRFMADLDARGYRPQPSMVAIDVSVPIEQ